MYTPYTYDEKYSMSRKRLQISSHASGHVMLEAGHRRPAYGRSASAPKSRVVSFAG